MFIWQSILKKNYVNADATAVARKKSTNKILSNTPETSTKKPKIQEK